MQQRLPIWSFPHLYGFVPLDESDAWQSAESVIIRANLFDDSAERVSLAALQRADSLDQTSLSAVRNLCVEYWLDETQTTTLCSFLPRIQNLQTLDMNVGLSRDMVVRVTSALQQLQHLQQLSLKLEYDFTVPIDSTLGTLLDVITTKPLVALWFGHESSMERENSKLLFGALLKLRGTLKCLQLGCTGNDDFFRLLCEMLLDFCNHSLQSFHLGDHNLTAAQMHQLCQTIHHVGSLRDLKVTAGEDAAVLALASHCQTFRPLRALSIRIAEFKLQSAQALFAGLQKNTRLNDLHVASFEKFERLIITADLIEQGWLESLSVSHELPLETKAKLQRNRDRKNGCERSCVRLIALRKHKRALVSTPFEIVVLIAQYLWDTRNLAVWN